MKNFFINGILKQLDALGADENIGTSAQTAAIAAKVRCANEPMKMYELLPREKCLRGKLAIE